MLHSYSKFRLFVAVTAVRSIAVEAGGRGTGRRALPFVCAYHTGRSDVHARLGLTRRRPKRRIAGAYSATGPEGRALPVQDWTSGLPPYPVGEGITELSDAAEDKVGSRTVPCPRCCQPQAHPWYQRMNFVRSKQRVADHGEVFTPPLMVEAMLDLVKDETERIDARFLEPPAEAATSSSRSSAASWPPSSSSTACQTSSGGTTPYWR